MSLINKLTKEQEAKIPLYCKKWSKVGFNTNPIDRKESEIAIKKYLLSADIKCDSVLFFSSPIMCNLAYVVMKNIPQLRSQLRSQLGSQLGSQLDSQLDSQLRSQLRSQLGSQLRSQLRSQLGSQLRSQLVINEWTDGSCVSGWCNFYDFIMSELKELQEEKTRFLWDAYINYVKTSFWIYPLNGICLASDRPKELHYLNGQLHDEKGMSAKFSDGWGIYSLHGVRVSKELVETPSEQLDPHLIVKEKNAEVRREIVRKIGIERVCQKLGSKTLDKKYGYELLTLDLGDGRNRPYLKMINPSTGTFHLEGIEPSITTIDKALSWRNQTDESPLVLT